ncbi:hypothetical protein CEE37_03450 [candidate division LCP-89 bacterium B3_LCP]|uniref:DUF7670 domain-containing protein n=1 Tax=candidate division LCP-89 bacterium B3_LCP TaxID=2012998 RepID=A0A532V369_UNCL8|nr:MAG: hypothetical protein CEE37_03450 [candidate division LCP-89 bacterium B3_LCP]
MSKILKILTTIFGLLYVLFLISGSYGHSGSEPLVIYIMFAVFLIGYVTMWKNELYCGLIFVLWWIGMWYLGVFVAEQDKGAAVVMGFPLFIIAILFIISGIKKKKATQ